MSNTVAIVRSLVAGARLANKNAIYYSRLGILGAMQACRNERDNLMFMARDIKN